MDLKTVTWNIGGAKFLNDGTDPTLMSSYTINGLKDIAKWLKSSNPDVITLQEVQGDNNGSQIEMIADYLGYKYFFYDPTSKSHLDKDQKLGNGIISRYPISHHNTGFFYNPNIQFDLEGVTVKSHDKGYSTCQINVNGVNIHTATLHLIPFEKVGLDVKSEVATKVLSSITKELFTNDSKVLIQGDFNIDDTGVAHYFSELFLNMQLNEITVDTPTTPSKRKYDHVLFKGLTLKEVHIDSSVKTDHYPVTCIFTFTK